MNLRMAVLVAPVAILLSACGSSDSTSTPPTHSEQQVQADVIDTCQGSAKKQLKDPDSAKFEGWQASKISADAVGTRPLKVSNYRPEQGDVLYRAMGRVNAKNGFGGYVGFQTYGCEAVVTTTYEMRALAYNAQEPGN